MVQEERLHLHQQSPCPGWGGHMPGLGGNTPGWGWDTHEAGVPHLATPL